MSNNNTSNSDANIIYALQVVSDQAGRLAAAITPNVSGCYDATGAHVESLTEAVMGMTAALMAISHAIEHVAEAMEGVER